MLYNAGVDVKSAQRFLGHASLEMTLGVYTHLSKYKEGKSIDALNGYLEENTSSNTKISRGSGYIGLVLHANHYGR